MIMQRKPHKTEEMIIDDLHEGVRELGALTTDSDTSTKLGQKAISAIRRLERAIPQVKGRVTNWKQTVGDKAKDAGDQFENFAKEKPWQLVGWAVGVGIFVGVLLSGGSSRKD
jgi:ElaB/YqjD/DUF883 family membrane-anchored ribosome-binding protein